MYVFFLYIGFTVSKNVPISNILFYIMFNADVCYVIIVLPSTSGDCIKKKSSGWPISPAELELGLIHIVYGSLLNLKKC